MDTAQDTRPGDTVPSHLRVRTGGMAAWLFLGATASWWVLDETGGLADHCHDPGRRRGAAPGERGLDRPGPDPVVRQAARFDPMIADSDLSSTNADELLASILKSSPPAGERPKQGYRGVRLVLVAAAVLLVATVGFISLPGTNSVSYASWEPSGRAPTQDELHGIISLCGDVAHGVEVAGDEVLGIQEVPVTPLVAEIRGEYSYLLSVGPAALAECFVSREGGQQPTVVTAEAIMADEFPLPSQSELIVHGIGTASWSGTDDDDLGTLTSAYGQVGANVDQIVITTQSGMHTNATIEDGWWVAWAPGSDSLRHNAHIILRDGTTLEIALSHGAP